MNYAASALLLIGGSCVVFVIWEILSWLKSKLLYYLARRRQAATRKFNYSGRKGALNK